MMAAPCLSKPAVRLVGGWGSLTVMVHRLARLRRFRFNLPQRIAAFLLALFLAQGLWLIAHQTLSARDYQYARCGREVWEQPSPITGYYTSCGNIHDGILAYRLAGLPLTLNFLMQRAIDSTRKPEDRIVQIPGEVSSWEMRHQLTHGLLLLRLPFLAVGCVLGGGLWWVTRRLFGNLGGYTALSLYCFSPSVLRACVSPNTELLAALSIYGGVYCCIGVAHAMQGPRRKWRPRILLLMALFALAAGAHIVALPLVLLFGFVAMLWIAEGSRSEIVPVLLVASVAAFVALFACYGFSPDAFAAVFRSGSALIGVSVDPARRSFTALANAGISVGAAAALVLFIGLRRTRYFGNVAPLICALLLLPLITLQQPSTPVLWAWPFLLTFIAGVFADAYEGPRRRLAMAAAGAIVALQAAFCLLSLPGML